MTCCPRSHLAGVISADTLASWPGRREPRRAWMWQRRTWLLEPGPGRQAPVASSHRPGRHRHAEHPV